MVVNFNSKALFYFRPGHNEPIKKNPENENWNQKRLDQSGSNFYLFFWKFYFLLTR